jgi:cyclin G2
MGLEGSEIYEKMDVFDSLRLLPQGPNPISSCGLESTLAEGSLNINVDDPNGAMQLLLQAQILLNKSVLYQKLECALQRSHIFRPKFNLPTSAANCDQVSCLHRDYAVNNLRFFNIFYGFDPSTFALSVNLLDRMLGKVKVHPRYLSCMATCCFYIAAHSQEEAVFIPSPAELVKLSQCAGSDTDLQRMEKLICEKLQWNMDDAITPLTFLQYFYDMYAMKGGKVADPSLLNSLVARLDVLMCQHQFCIYRAETLALALISLYMKEKKLIASGEQLSVEIELQYYCQISDAELTQCRSMVSDYLQHYNKQPSRLPRLQLTWTVSRRTLTKLKPSTRVILDLEPIMEDEDLEDSDDAGPFDSENDDVEIKQNKLKICPYFPRLEPEDQGDLDDELPPSPVGNYNGCNDFMQLPFKIHSTEKPLLDDGEADEVDNYNEECDAEKDANAAIEK